MLIGDASFLGPFAAEARISEVDAGAVVLGAGSARFEDATARTLGSGRTYGVSATLDVDQATLSPGEGLTFSGKLRAAGDDAAVLLDLAGADEAVRLTLSLLEDSPFTLAARISRRPSSTVLRDVDFGSAEAALQARGTFFAGEETRRGAFVLRRDTFRLGITVHQDAVRTRFGVDEAWLSDQTRTVEAAAAHEAPGVETTRARAVP
jgi:hypothetical protein